MNIVFAGTPDFAVPALASLLDSEHNVVAVYTQPDRPAGRGRHLQASPVKSFAEMHNVPVFQPESFRDAAEVDILRAMQPDIMVVVAYGLLLPESVLTIPTHGCINIHASLLPRWRGAAPIQHSILAGDQETGVCIMQMEKGLDTGPVLNRVSCAIHASDNAGDLHDRLAEIGAEALLMTLLGIERGDIKAQKQDHTLKTYAHKISKADAQLDWTQSAHSVNLAIRAYNPWPIAHSVLLGKPIRFYQAQVLNQPAGDKRPGEIIAVNDDSIDIACGKQQLRVTQMQLAGGKCLAVTEILKGHKDLFVPGMVFGPTPVHEAVKQQ